ncbi:cytochrome P450 4V2-like [Argiope bruennichi]|uniref:cytochrome P450 4V2-like n=1 Tax=Argiope bruennichi TaxID=94029 RepID=UPI002494BDEC|nr:cytochrome P450 4V2-like [Argiope bruennichi]
MLLLIFYILIGMSFAFLLKCSFWRYKYSRLMPGRKPSVFNILGDIGELIDFRHLGSTDSIHLKFMETLRNLNKTFQKDRLFCTWILYTPFVFLVKAEAVKEALSGNKMKEKSWLYKFLGPLFGYGLTTSPHVIWKPRRKLLNRCFHSDILRGFLPVFNEHAQELVKVFRESENEFTEISHTIALCALDIICETAFDVKLKTLGNNESQYANAVRRLCELVLYRIYSFWLWPDVIAWNTPLGKEAKVHLKFMREFTEKVIREKKERYLSLGPGADKGKRHSLLDVLLKLHLVEHELTEEDVKHEVDTFALAGHDTAAVTATWALYLIGLNPDVQVKVHEELDRIFGENIDKDITENDLNDLCYLDCVVKEALRLYPAVPMFGRHVEEDTTICGYTLPKGASCFILSYFLHRDEDVFPDPEKFDLNRFSPENTIKIPEFAYIPFSAGPRNCIGYRFATMEVKILLATILRNFTIESLEERDKVLPVMHVALHPSSPVYVKFRSRSTQKN